MFFETAALKVKNTQILLKDISDDFSITSAPLQMFPSEFCEIFNGSYPVVRLEQSAFVFTKSVGCKI